jgi:nucleoside-diphosphate-sugar epimerase
VRNDARRAWQGAHHVGALIPADRPVIVASHVLAWGGFGDREITEDDTPVPVAMGHWGLAAEQALERPGLRAVRLGWVYGPGGMFARMIGAVRYRQYRIVGDGTNRMPVISLADAVGALRAAASAPDGIYAAAEDASPSQEELIYAMCAAAGVRRPDHVSARLAALSLGAGMTDALRASVRITPRRLAALGWSPKDRWHDAIPALIRPEDPSAPAAHR